jgi:hypothetical protein
VGVRIDRALRYENGLLDPTSLVADERVAA